MQVYAGSDEDYEIETKMDKSFLTKADKLAHAEISSQLSQTSYPLLSEEGRSIDYEERRHWKKYWIVDPLDGTKEFLKRNGEFTVNIALIEEGVPVMGVIYVPVSETLYFGIDGIGAYKIVGVNLDTASLTAEEWLKRGSKLPVGMDRTGFVVVASRSRSSRLVLPLALFVSCFIGKVRRGMFACDSSPSPQAARNGSCSRAF